MAIGNSILITADSLIDTDIGLIKYVSKEFTNNLVDNKVHESINSFFYEFLLNIPKDENVLTGIVLNDTKLSKVQCDEYYRLFILEKYKDILKYSPMIETICRLFNAYTISSTSTGISVTILCRNEDEKEIITNLCHGANCIVYDNLSELDINSYSRFIFRKIRDLAKIGLDKFRGKNIIVLGYRYNFDEDNSKKLLSSISFISDINKFETIIPYDDYELSEG